MLRFELPCATTSTFFPSRRSPAMQRSKKGSVRFAVSSRDSPFGGGTSYERRQSFTRAARFRFALLRQRHVHPAREPVLEVPERLAMAHEDEGGHGPRFYTATSHRARRAPRPRLTCGTALRAGSR